MREVGIEIMASITRGFHCVHFYDHHSHSVNICTHSLHRAVCKPDARKCGQKSHASLRYLYLSLSRFWGNIMLANFFCKQFLYRILRQLYRVIKTYLCTWWLQYTSFLSHYLAQSYCLAADRQGQGDTRHSLTPSVIPNSNYVIMVSDWNCLKYFCVFLYCNHQVHREFLITLYNGVVMKGRTNGHCLHIRRNYFVKNTKQPEPVAAFATELKVWRKIWLLRLRPIIGAFAKLRKATNSRSFVTSVLPHATWQVSWKSISDDFWKIRRESRSVNKIWKE
jgi:hypothetical protein